MPQTLNVSGSIVLKLEGEHVITIDDDGAMTIRLAAAKPKATAKPSAKPNGKRRYRLSGKFAKQPEAAPAEATFRDSDGSTSA